MDFNKTVFELCNENEKLREFLISKGFEPLKNDKLFKTMAKMIKLKDALKMKNIDRHIFMEEFNNYNGVILEDENIEKEGKKFIVEGAVPCPIRVPLMENLKEISDEKIKEVDFDLRSANLGLDFVTQKFKNKEKLPDLITSAGFDLVLDEEIFEEIEKNYVAPSNEFNEDFINRGADLKDPNGVFYMLGVVPCVFIVNKNALGGRGIPKSWEELLSGEFNNKITIPVSDLDMYNAILVTLYSKFGLDGLRKLKDGFYSRMHPAQMVKQKNDSGACVSLCPYFFANMIKNESLELVWPEDGAIISPIFMTAKKSSIDNLKEVIDYFTSQRIGEIFSFNGKFPSTNLRVDNNLRDDYKFLWASWDLLNNKREKMKKDISKVFEL
ncbi:ABC transporter substrate-binding protein [uncultured Peptoniphilus sp.]|uniref:ABC transporter substrate-binding protein n=1 Tax=uncultured Peptoniphilus sp. TaxID=254354 RepID=UPI0028049879|nr:ABC transporter substrate-binding protein [uncultured Peptoniphilus sp.]